MPAAEIATFMPLLEVRQTLAGTKIAYLQVTGGWRRGNLLGRARPVADEGMPRAQAAQATAHRRCRAGKSYGPSHPKMIAAQSELAQATENLNNQAHSVTEGIRNATSGEVREAAIVAALNRAGQQYQQVGRKSESREPAAAVDTIARSRPLS